MDTVTKEQLEEFERYWKDILHRIDKEKVGEESIFRFKVEQLIRVFSTKIRCCKEIYNTILFRLTEVHNEALWYADLYNLLDKDSYPFSENFIYILPHYVIIMED